jgi:hypothetical protein
MGHRPVEIESSLANEKLSRPAELVQRAKQLAQLTNFQFGKNAVPTIPAAQPVPAPVGTTLAPAIPAAAVAGSTSAAVATLEAQPRLSIPPQKMSAATVAPSQGALKTTDQKIAEFYGVKQLGETVIFNTKFDWATDVRIAGDFNNWSPEQPMRQDPARPGEWKLSLPLRPGRYRYRLVVDGKWMTDPFNKYVETNQFGELNNVVEVK